MANTQRGVFNGEPIFSEVGVTEFTDKFSPGTSYEYNDYIDKLKSFMVTIKRDDDDDNKYYTETALDKLKNNWRLTLNFDAFKNDNKIKFKLVINGSSGGGGGGVGDFGSGFLGSFLGGAFAPSDQ